MQVHRDINNLPFFVNPVVTIGTFDGVHTGHVQIIHQLKNEAKKINGETVIVTFDPHPRMIVDASAGQVRMGKTKKNTSNKVKLLNTLSEKIELLEKHEIDHLVIVPFTHAFSEQIPEGYIKDFLVKNFHPHTLIIGYDHHFGKNRQGNYKLLENYAFQFNYRVKEIPEHILNHVTISSTKIREAILNCDMETANKYLGYDYFFEGEVVQGDKIGKSIGYPTANLELNDENKLVPGNGIYAVKIIIGNGQWANAANMQLMKGMMSIGIRPTIGNSKKTIEVNIFDFDKDIYGQTVRVCVKKYLREEKKFSGLEELKNEIAKDKINALEAFV